MKTVFQTKFALGGDITLAVISDMGQTDIDTLFHKMWRQVYIFEKSFSRFLPMSELSSFNRTAGLKTPISPELEHLLKASKLLGEKTEGLYNPFILPALQRVGYKKSAAVGYERDSQIDYTNRKVVGIERLIVGDGWAKIPYGTALDTGGCGKGYLGDQLGKLLDTQPVTGYWLSLGGDILTKGLDENGEKIQLHIQSSHNLTGFADWIVECPSKHFATATSGTFRRKNQTSENNWHHIIDPKTLKPAETDINLATVCADSTLRADVLASCAVILGSDKAFDFLRQHGAVAALLQCTDKNGKAFDKVFGAEIQNKRSRTTSKVARRNA